MINVPTTDILTQIIGEVEKPTTIDRSETAEVSFQSVIVANDIDMDAMIAASNQPLASQTYPTPKIDYVGLEAAFPAFIRTPDAAPETVIDAQSGQPLAPNQVVPSSPLSTAPVMALGEGSGDTDQLAMTTTSVSKGAQQKNLGAVFNPVAEGAVIGVGGTTNVRRPTVTDLPPVGGNLAVHPAIVTPVVAEHKNTGPMAQVRTDIAVPSKQNTQTATPTNVAFPDTAQSKTPTASTEGPLLSVDPSKARAISEVKPTPVQQPIFAPQVQNRPIEPSIGESQPVKKVSVGDKVMEPKSTPIPIQATAPRPTQMPTIDLPLDQTVSTAPVGVQKTLLNTDSVQPELLRPSTLQPQQIQSEAPPKPTVPQKEIQAPTQGYQSQIKQPRAQPVVVAATPSPSNDVTPQATLSPTVERHTVKPNNPPTAMPQTRVQSKNGNAQIATAPEVGSTMPVSETAAAGTIDPVSAPELIPFDVKGGDSLTNLRQDANINRPEVMRHVAQQLADVARQMPDRPVELALNPEELGRVRLTFTTTDGGIHIAVMAERGETMDLLRRHIESLAQEFREMGYKDVNFEFSQNGQNDAQNGDADTQNNSEPDAAHAQTQPLAPIQLSLEPSVGLDLRL